MNKKIILASQSPRRKQLLEQAEIEFEIQVIETDESFPKELPINEVPIYIAEQKANMVAIANKDAVVIGADTIVVLENEIIGKPKNEKDAIDILQKLSNKEHQVITGVCIMYLDKKITFSSTTIVQFNELNTNDILHYVQKYKPFDKAGAYAIQEWIGAIGIKSINGDYYNVMGLPINKVVKVINELY